jgi:hypothetical protein
MKRAYLVLASVLAFAVMCYPTLAQDAKPSEPRIDFSDAAKPKVYRWDANDPSCSNYKRDDTLVTVMTTPEAEIVVYLLPPTTSGDLKKYFIFAVVIYNKGERSFTVEPRNITATVLGKKATTLQTIPLDEVTKAISKHGSPSFLAGLFRPTKAGTITTTDARGNTSTTVVRVPDEEAEAEREAAEAERREKQGDRATQTYDLGLKANTVFKGEDVDGVIFFDMKKILSDGGFILNIPLGSFSFEIPFGKARTGK